MFKFSIRDLLLLTVITALAVGWWIDRSRLNQRAIESDNWKFRAESLAERVTRFGGEVAWDDQSILITQISADGKRFTMSRNKEARPLSHSDVQALMAAHAKQPASSGPLAVPLPAAPKRVR
jgi:hypothetical protein